MKASRLIEELANDVYWKLQKSADLLGDEEVDKLISEEKAQELDDLIEEFGEILDKRIAEIKKVK
jgi:hypothetical protein